MKRKWIVLGMLTLGSILAAFVIAAPPDGRGKSPSRERGSFGGFLDNPKMIEHLGLSSEQVEQMRNLHYQGEQKQIDLRATLQKARLKIHHLMEQDQPDEAAIMGSIEEAGQAHIAMRKLQVQQRLKGRDLLGTEASNKLRRYMADRMRSRHRGGDRPHHMGHDRNRHHGDRSGDKPRHHRSNIPGEDSGE